MMMVQRMKGSEPWRRRGRVTLLATGVAAVTVALGMTPAALASPRFSAASTLPPAKPGVITEQDYYTVGDNTEMVAFINQFEKQNPGYTVKRDVFPSGNAASQNAHGGLGAPAA